MVQMVARFQGVTSETFLKQIMPRSHETILTAGQKWSQIIPKFQEVLRFCAY